MRKFLFGSVLILLLGVIAQAESHSISTSGEPPVPDDQTQDCYSCPAILEVCAGETFKIDVSNTYGSDSSIAKVTLGLVDSNDVILEKIMMSNLPFHHKFKIDEAGNYKIITTALDDNGTEGKEKCVLEVRVVDCNYPPVCILRVDIAGKEDCSGAIITADASGSYDPDGGISKVSIRLVDESGNVVEEKTMSNALYLCTFKVAEGGNYSVVAEITDDSKDGYTSRSESNLAIMICQMK